jgi:hypothetical protein
VSEEREAREGALMSVEERLSWLRVSEEREAREGALMSAEERLSWLRVSEERLSSVHKLTFEQSCLQLGRSGSREEACSQRLNEPSRAPSSQRALTSFSSLTKQQVLRAHLELSQSGCSSGLPLQTAKEIRAGRECGASEVEPIAVVETE